MGKFMKRIGHCFFLLALCVMTIGLTMCATPPSLDELNGTQIDNAEVEVLPSITPTANCFPPACTRGSEATATPTNTPTTLPTATSTVVAIETQSIFVRNSFNNFFNQSKWLLADDMDRVYYSKEKDPSQNRLNLSKYGIFTSLDNVEINADEILIIGHSSGFDGYVLRGMKTENFSEEEYLVVVEKIEMDFNNKCPAGSYCDVDLFVGFGDPQQQISKSGATPKPQDAYNFGGFIAFRKWRDSNLEGHYYVCVLKSLHESCKNPIFETTSEDEFAAEEWIIRFSKNGGTLYYSVEMDETTIVPKTSVPSNNLRYFWIGYKLAGTATVNATITIPEEITCMR